MEDLRTVNNNQIDWDAFREWLRKNGTSERWARYLVNYARPYSDCLVKDDLSKVRDLPETQRPNAIKGLSALSKYLGINERFKRLVKNYGLKWVGKSSTDIILDRLNKIKDPDEVFKWVKEAKRQRPELGAFLDFMATTGLRLVESIESYNLIVNLDKKDKLGEYYNGQTGTLEHFKFKELFIRHNKKVFISFVPKDIIQNIIDQGLIPGYDAVQGSIRKRGMKQRFGDARESWASFMVKHLQQPEIDFIQGRVSTNVFMRNYFNPALIGDLKERAFRGIKEIRGKIQ